MNLRLQSKIESKKLLDRKLSELFNAYAEIDDEVDKSIEDLKEENFLLFEIAKTTLLFIRAQEIIESEISTGAGLPAIDENQEILKRAYADYWENYEKAPDEPQWFNWLERTEYDPAKKYIVAAETQFARTKNGWGKEKVRKDLAKFKSMKFQIMELLEEIYGMK